MNVLLRLTAILATAGCGSTHEALTIVAPVTPSTNAIYESVGAPIEESACFRNVLLFFGWGESSSHAALISRVLARTGTDAIVDARLESTGHTIPIVYQSSCTVVRGRPAKLAHVEPAKAIAP